MYVFKYLSYISVFAYNRETQIMKTATVTEFRTRAKELLQEVEDDQDILILSRPKGQEGFVVLTMGHFESLEETAHLLSSPENATRLLKGIEEARAGIVARSFNIDELTKLAPFEERVERERTPARVVRSVKQAGAKTQIQSKRRK